MNSPDRIFDLFPELSVEQHEQINKLGALYSLWNNQINVISRKDMEHFYVRHVLHSLLLGLNHPLEDSKVMDVGTGGGFPGLPLAILYPEAQFTLVDSIGKKLKVVDEIAAELGIKNITTKHERMESLRGSYDYITGRAVKSLPVVFNWTKHLVNWNKGLGKAGMLYLKGGEFLPELKSIPRKAKIIELAQQVPNEDFFETKKLVYLYQSKS